jgi:hypothetical protein
LGFELWIGGFVKNTLRKGVPSWLGWVLIFVLTMPIALHAEKNTVMGKVEFEGRSKIEKTSGVWVDGQYVGYLKELKGSKAVLLLPGSHVITVRQDGYQDFTKTLEVQPGQTEIVAVAMEKARTGSLPLVLATVKVAVNPSRAAVFVDGQFVGHVKEFQGMHRGMLVAPGDHLIKIALPGYQTFQTEIKAEATQTVEIKTDLLKSNGPLAAPLVKGEAGATTPDSGARQTAEKH